MVVVCQLMMYSNVIVGITISLGSFVFSQSRVKVSTRPHQYRKPVSRSI